MYYLVMCNIIVKAIITIHRIRGNFREFYISREASLNDFRDLIFAGHQVEYIVS